MSPPTACHCPSWTNPTRGSRDGASPPIAPARLRMSSSRTRPQPLCPVSRQRCVSPHSGRLVRQPHPPCMPASRGPSPPASRAPPRAHPSSRRLCSPLPLACLQLLLPSWTTAAASRPRRLRLWPRPALPPCALATRTVARVVLHPRSPTLAMLRLLLGLPPLRSTTPAPPRLHVPRSAPPPLTPPSPRQASTPCTLATRTVARWPRRLHGHALALVDSGRAPLAARPPASSVRPHRPRLSYTRRDLPQAARHPRSTYASSTP